MVEELQKDPSKFKLGGERKEMTFMFMDICGFTPISEHYKNNDDFEGSSRTDKQVLRCAN